MVLLSPINSFKNVGHFINEHPLEMAQCGVALIALGILGNYYPSLYEGEFLPRFNERAFATALANSLGTLCLIGSFTVVFS